MTEDRRTRQNLLLFVETAVDRAEQGFVLCTWGCREWLEPVRLEEHQEKGCAMRVVACRFGCGVRLRAEAWRTVQVGSPKG